jgi:hypothetical protein
MIGSQRTTLDIIIMYTGMQISSVEEGNVKGLSPAFLLGDETVPPST